MVAVPDISKASQSQTAPVLESKDLQTYFYLEKSTVRALDGVNLTLQRKSTLGLVVRLFDRTQRQFCGLSFATGSWIGIVFDRNPARMGGDCVAAGLDSVYGRASCRAVRDCDRGLPVRRGGMAAWHDQRAEQSIDATATVWTVGQSPADSISSLC